MIISASRRTDIPAFYADWLTRRLREGLVLAPQPRNPKRLGLVRLSPDTVDCLVFWTKNPAPLLEKLRIIDDLGYRYYFTFTVTAHGPDAEPGLPPKREIVETFLRLADRLGPAGVDWRFDPVWLHGPFDRERHLDRFGELARRLAGATERCIVNFVKGYRHLGGRVEEAPEEDLWETARGLAAVAAEFSLPLVHCTDRRDLRPLGFRAEACIDRRKIEALIGGPLAGRKDPGQPKICRCLESFDLGMYDTCGHGCAYCYAVTSAGAAARRMAAHDPDSPMLAGRPVGDETVTDRTAGSLRRESGLF